MFFCVLRKQVNNESSIDCRSCTSTGRCVAGFDSSSSQCPSSSATLLSPSRPSPREVRHGHIPPQPPQSPAWSPLAPAAVGAQQHTAASALHGWHSGPYAGPNGHAHRTAGAAGPSAVSRGRAARPMTAKAAASSGVNGASPSRSPGEVLTQHKTG